VRNVAPNKKVYESGSTGNTSWKVTTVWMEIHQRKETSQRAIGGLTFTMVFGHILTISSFFQIILDGYPLVNIQTTTVWEITMFNGKIHYKWLFSMENHCF
jgi:hypothetical protein